MQIRLVITSQYSRKLREYRHCSSICAFCVTELQIPVTWQFGYFCAMYKERDPQPQPTSRTEWPSCICDLSQYNSSIAFSASSKVLDLSRNKQQLHNANYKLISSHKMQLIISRLSSVKVTPRGTKGFHYYIWNHRHVDWWYIPEKLIQ